jgi:hypothetical protein
MVVIYFINWVCDLNSHKMMRPHRKLFAVVLTTIYLTIALSPLAPLAMHSKSVTHAITGECVSDCNICGCSQESRANYTCCCAKKKQMHAGVEKHRESDKKSCCASSKPVKPVVAKNDCCAKNEQHQPKENVQELNKTDEQTSNESTVLKCGCPCGKGKPFALNGFGSNELLPIITNERVEIPHIETLFADLSHRLASRHGEPPDPPPKLTHIS